MKTKTVVMIFTLICLTSFSFAGQMTQQKGEQQPKTMPNGKMTGMEWKGVWGHIMGNSIHP